MSKFQELQQVPGVKDLATLITFLSDQTRLTEHMEKLESARKDVNEQLKQLDIGKDVERAKTQAVEALNDAKAKLKTAVDAAAKTKAGADDYAEDSARRAGELFSEREEILTTKERALSKEDARLTKLAAALDKQSAEAQALSERAKEALHSAKQQQSDLTAKAERIAAAASL
jgi:hypothetical protein